MGDRRYSTCLLTRSSEHCKGDYVIYAMCIVPRSDIVTNVTKLLFLLYSWDHGIFRNETRSV